MSSKNIIRIMIACVVLAVLAGIFAAASGAGGTGLSRSDRAAIDGYNKLVESCQANQGGCRAAEAQRQKFHEEGICRAVNEEQDKLAHGGFYRCMPR